MMTKDKINFSLRLNPYIHKKITDEAKRLGVSKNALVTMLINENLKGESENGKFKIQT